MALFELNARLRSEMKPIIRQFVNVYHYTDIEDFSEEHREELYGHLLSCKAIDMQQVNELICFDEYVQGLCLGYIKADEAKPDLMERLDDLFYKPLDHWIQYEAQLESESRARPAELELHELLWASEARARAEDHNKSCCHAYERNNE
jgi:hypothetical protein